jgi:CxxC motif-containing protein (DUF1111 family)
MALVLVLGGCAAGLDDEEDPRAGSGNFGVEQQGNSAHFFVNNAAWADIHYRVNGGGQLNIRMAVSNNHNSFDLPNLAAGTVVDYNFTYFDLACPCAKDSPMAKYVHGGGNPQPPPPPPPPPNPDPPPPPPPPGGNGDYPLPNVPSGPTTGGLDRSNSVVPLFTGGTPLEPATVSDIGSALVTRVGDRVRDRHARENQFRAYDHFLALYFKDRTFSLEIVDQVAKGGNKVVVNLKTVYPFEKPDFRAFFRGINTSAEYWHNGQFVRVNDLQHTASVDFNAKEGRPIKVGDRMEMEVGVFLRQPVEGRFNYYSTVWLYIVGQGGIVPLEGQGALRDSFPMPEKAWLGGRTTLNQPFSDEPDKRFMQMATNIAPVSAQPWVEGRRLLHTSFADGSHSEPGNPAMGEHAGKIGGHHVARSCVTCHKNNGRALPAAVGATLITTGVKVGTTSGGADAKLGRALQPFPSSGASEGSAQLKQWDLTNGTFADGTPYQLRRPRYAGTGTIPAAYSMRISPPLIGLGLLEAVPESAIAALVDVNDGNGDGVSGRMNVVDDRNGQPRMGRFGWKAGQPSLREQIAHALAFDMGVRTSLFNFLDCGAQQSGCSGGGTLADQALGLLVRYVALLGVPARRNPNDALANQGEQLFQSAGCASCHRPTLPTSNFHPHAELRGQTIRPYTDLLLHDMGPGLADNLPEGLATGGEWRTPPLWGIGLTAGVSGGQAYLHDGRARNLSEAILWHGGEGQKARDNFVAMPASQRNALLAFLANL